MSSPVFSTIPPPLPVEKPPDDSGGGVPNHVLFMIKLLGNKTALPIHEQFDLLPKGLSKIAYEYGNCLLPRIHIEDGVFQELCHPGQESLIVKILGLMLFTGTSHQHFLVLCWQHIHCLCLVLYLTESLVYIIPVLSSVLLYSKRPHKELRFIISSLPMFNLSAAIAASRIYNNRKKFFWKYLYIGMLGLFVISLGRTIVTFMASYENYPSGYVIRALHKMGHLKNKSEEVWVHIDTFSAINGISRFCEDDESWRYSKEEEIPLQEFKNRNFTYLLRVKGFSGVRLRAGFPPISLVKKTKVYVHGNAENEEIIHISWWGC
ncbi:dolichyl-P-Man:Man(7)GlcNAc(2)-PP-dolichol alpha-1,6-mannosyltransferase [Orobanche hederae]